MAYRILIVEDIKMNRELLAAVLQSFGYETETAADGFEALAKIKLDIDLVLLDLNMPGKDGYEVLQEIRKDDEIKDIPVCIVTGNHTREDRLRAVEHGANDFIAKPVDDTELGVRVRSLLRQKVAQDAIKQHDRQLQEKFDARTKELRRALDEMAEAQRQIQLAYLDTIHRLALAAEYKDENTGEHIQRVSRICEMISNKMSRPPRETEIIRVASPLHDVGKLGIPDYILLKKGRLVEEEYQLMQKHTIIGARILDGSSSELLNAGKEIALTHHERWDGKGYPMKLSGEEIPMNGRICAIADVFDALFTRRSYKGAFELDEVLHIMKSERGRHFDPELLDVFLDDMDEILDFYGHRGMTD